MIFPDFKNDAKPFSGLKVLDISNILAGPLAASFFAELGATVVKVENKLTAGDATRTWKLPGEDPASPYSAYYFSANYGKEVVLLDLTNPADRQKAEEMIADSDVVISNFQKKVAQKLGLLPEETALKYPSLIFAQLSAYEFDDPRPGYDLVMQGETGWISMTGTDDSHLAKIPVAVIDIFASHQIKEAVLIALIKRAVTGKGSTIHVSLYKSGISGLANQASNYLMQGVVAKPIGTLHPNIAPYGDIFTSADGTDFLLAVGSDDQFKKLWKTLMPGVAINPNFESNSGRVKNRKELCKALQQSFGSNPFVKIETLLGTINVPYCSILKMNDVFEDKLAKEMVLTQTKHDETGQSVSSIAFTIK